MAYDPFGTQSYAQNQSSAQNQSLYSQNQSIGQPASRSERARRFLKNNPIWQMWTGQNAAYTPATQSYAQRATPALAASFYGPTKPPASTQNQSLEVFGPTRPTSQGVTTPSTSTSKPTSPFNNQLPSAQNVADSRGLTGIERQRFIEAASGISSPQPTFKLQGGPAQTQSFATPQVSPLQQQFDTAQKQYDEARQRFLGLLDNREIADLEKQLADYRTATQTAVTGEEGQGRGKTASLVRGRQALLEQQRGIEEQNLLTQLDITRNLINQKQSAAYQAMGFAKEDLDNIREQVLTQGQESFGEIKEFGDQLLRIAPDGTVSVLAQRSPEAMKPITVSAGQTVIDPNTGEVLFQAGERPEALPTSIQEYMFAAQQGYQGTYNDFKNQSSTSGTGKLSSAAQQDIVSINTANNVINEIMALASPSGNLPGVGMFGGRLPQFLTGANQQQVRAKLGLLRAAIAKANAGTSFTEGEKALLEEYLPTPTDTDSMIRTKLQNLQSYLTNKAQEIQSVAGGSFGQSFGPPTDPQYQMYYNLLQGGQITPEEYQELTGSFTNDLSMSQNGSMDSFKAAIAKQESGGRYNAVGPPTSKGNRAYGKYQVMDFNIPSWTQQALGRSMTPQQFLNDPQAQEAVASYKFNEIYNKYGNWGDVASVWFSGRPVSQAGNASDVTGTSTPQYVRNILSMMG